MFSALLAACSGAKKSDQENATTPGEEMKLKQYVVQGRGLYQTYCQNCHGQDGKGLARLYPPLAKSDYLLSDLPRAACVIQYGQKGAILVNGQEYNQQMPAFPSLTPLEEAEILTYVTNEWGNNAGISNVTEVSQWLDECQQP